MVCILGIRMLEASHSLSESFVTCLEDVDLSFAKLPDRDGFLFFQFLGWKATSIHYPSDQPFLYSRWMKRSASEWLVTSILLVSH